MLRVVVDIEVSETGAHLNVNSAWLRPNAPPEQCNDTAVVLRALEMAQKGVMNGVGLEPPAIVRAGRIIGGEAIRAVGGAGTWDVPKSNLHVKEREANALFSIAYDKETAELLRETEAE